MKSYFKVLILLFSILVLIVGCNQQGSESDVEGITSATESRYREKEIREYEGARLDPTIGPRDNSIKGIQNVNIETYSLKITGLVDKTVDLKYQDVLDLDSYERKITLYCVEGWDATILWKGVLIEDLLNISGISSEANTIIFHAVDGYTTSLPLETIIDNELILAYSANGLELPPEMGYPFIVVAEDKLGYKWARWVSEIEISDDENYRGFWEERGYSNEADI